MFISSYQPAVHVCVPIIRKLSNFHWHVTYVQFICDRKFNKKTDRKVCTSRTTHKYIGSKCRRRVRVLQNDHPLRLMKQWTLDYDDTFQKYFLALLAWFLGLNKNLTTDYTQKIHPIFILCWINLQDEQIYKLCPTHSIQMLVSQYIAHSIGKKKNWRTALTARLYILLKNNCSHFSDGKWVLIIPSLPANWQEKKREV